MTFKIMITKHELIIKPTLRSGEYACTVVIDKFSHEKVMNSGINRLLIFTLFTFIHNKWIFSTNILNLLLI